MFYVCLEAIQHMNYTLIFLGYQDNVYNTKNTFKQHLPAGYAA